MTDLKAPGRQPLWRNHDFQILWAGETVSQLGSTMSLFVFPLLAYASTGSVVAAAVVEAALALGQVVAMLPAGALVDRVNRKRVMLVANGLGAALYGSLALATWLGGLTLVHLTVVAAATGVAGSFFHPAESAAIRQVVPTEDLPTALSQNQARTHAASLVGGPLGGALYSAARWLPFAVDTVTFAMACLAISRIRHPLPAPARGPEAPRMRRDIAEGLRFIWQSRFLRTFLVYATLGNAAGAAFFLVVFLRLVQAGVHPALIGVTGTFAGVAGIAGAIAAPAIIRRLPTGWLSIASAWMWVIATLPMAFTTNVWIIGSLLALGVFLGPVTNAALGSYRMAITPDHLQGRSQSAMNFAAMAVMPLGPLAGGFLLASLDGATAQLLTLAPLAVAAVVITLSAAVREVPRPDRWAAAPVGQSAR